MYYNESQGRAKVPLVIEKYLGANRSKEMKIKNLLKFFLLLEEDCKIEGLYIVLEIHHFSLLRFWPFSKHENSLLWGDGRKAEGEGSFPKVVPGVV